MFPRKDSELVPYSANFGAKISASASDYGITAPEAALFQTKRTAYAAAYDAVQDAKASSIRSGPLCAEKDLLKLDLLRYGRSLYAHIQFSTTVSDALKLEAGIVVRKTHYQRQPRPAFAPGAVVVNVNGRLMTIRLFDTQRPGSKSRPAATSGAMILSHVGLNPPDNVDDWDPQGLTGDLTVDVLFPDSVVPGSTVHVIAYWFNNRKESGPACLPLTAVIGYPSSLPTSEAA